MTHDARPVGLWQALNIYMTASVNAAHPCANALMTAKLYPQAMACDYRPLLLAHDSLKIDQILPTYRHCEELVQLCLVGDCLQVSL